MSTAATEHNGKGRAEFVCDTAGCFLTVHIRGEIDHHTAAGIRQGIDATLFEKRPKKLILDLSAVSFMDSSGLGLIMGRFSVMKELGGELTVWNPSRETRSILTLAGMERLIQIEYPPDGTDSHESDHLGQVRREPVRREGTRREGTRREKSEQVQNSMKNASARPSRRRAEGQAPTAETAQSTHSAQGVSPSTKTPPARKRKEGVQIKRKEKDA